MAVSANLASALFAAKPAATPAPSYVLPLPSAAMTDAIAVDLEDALYAATLSYVEGVRGLKSNNVSWAAVKLYYSVFYCMRTAMLLSEVINFHAKRFYLCDARNGRVSTGASSSHDWSWTAIRSFARLGGHIFSSESEAAYKKLRHIRERSSYNEPFTDPSFPGHYARVGATGVAKAFRAYRDDSGRILTYLDDHLAFAYPTQSIFEVVGACRSGGVRISADREAQVRRTWPLDDSPPL